MELDEIWIHDCVLHRVEEITSTQELLFHVQYPFNWHKDDYRPRIIAFLDVTGYSVDNGLFRGPPSLLDWDQAVGPNGRRRVTIEGNDGTRSLECRAVELRLPPGDSGPLDDNER